LVVETGTIEAAIAGDPDALAAVVDGFEALAGDLRRIGALAGAGARLQKVAASS
jgi:hypothetical protein